MKKNMGLADKVVRFIAAALIVVFYLAGYLSGPVSIILLLLAGIFILTGLVGFCPLYYPFGISTCKTKKHS